VDFETAKQALSAEICEWRERRNLSQEKFAEESSLHVNEVGKLERCETNPQLDTLLLLAKGMNMSPAALFSALEKRGLVREGNREGEATL
jgi:transcriptional regulator with XRE-family HTH domain